jgi:hypothetical protein
MLMTFQRNQLLGNPNALVSIAVGTIVATIGSVSIVGYGLSKKGPEEQANSIVCESTEQYTLEPSDTPRSVAQTIADNEHVNANAYYGHLLDTIISVVFVNNNQVNGFVADTTEITVPTDCSPVN